MNSINLNYIRGLYDFLFDKSDEELEEIDINSNENQQIFFKEMAHTFNHFGPISKRNILDGLNVIFVNSDDDDLWRKAIPHDLPLGRVMDRKNYLKGLIYALTNNLPPLSCEWEILLVNEVGSNGLDFSE